MKMSLARKLDCLKFNFFPALRGSGARVIYIAEDFRKINVRLPLNWRTRNRVGTMFGGSMYAAADPFYMIMLMQILGRDYIVWDRSATIRFKRPGKETLFAEFVITEEETNEIVTVLETRKSTNRNYTVELLNAGGEVHAIVEKEIYVARKREPIPVAVPVTAAG